MNENNEALQEILSKVNSLPEAGSSSGGGATVETCEVTIVGWSNALNVFYTDENGLCNITVPAADYSGMVPTPGMAIINCLCESMLFVTGGGSSVESYRNDMLAFGTGYACVWIVNNGEIVVA